MNAEVPQPDPASGAAPGTPDDLMSQLLEGKAETGVDLYPQDAASTDTVSAATSKRILPEWFLPPAGPGDRWAHRRGEPRTFAFLWTLYLLLATVAMFWKVLRAGVPTLDIYRPAMRVLLVSAAAGATVVWPMIRLCQESPRGKRVAHAIADVVVILLPLQAVLWPQVLLAQWSAEVVLAVDLLFGAWVAMCGAIVLWGWERRGVWRAMPVGLCILVVGVGPLIGLTARALSGAGTGLGHWSLASPLTGVYALTHVEIGDARRGEVEGWQWAAIGATWVMAVLTWVLALIRGWGGRGVTETGGVASEPSPA